jgi:hypothetical protein
MAARAWIHDNFTCGGFGERKGNTVTQLLERYYTFSFENLEYEIY